MVSIQAADEWGYSVRVTVGDEVSHYDITAGSQNGIPVWVVHRYDPAASIADQVKGESYVVDVDGPFGSSCTCPDSSHHGHCDHQDFLRVLLAEGKIAHPGVED